MLAILICVQCYVIVALICISLEQTMLGIFLFPVEI